MEDKVGFVCGGKVTPRDKVWCEQAHVVGAFSSMAFFFA